MKKHNYWILSLLGLLVLGACSKGVPMDKRDIVGFWKSEHITLAIQVNGSVMYVDKTDAAKTKTVQGNIRRFDDDGFVVGYPPFDTRIAITKPPYQDGADMKMIINDVELVRYQEPPEGQKTFSM